MKVAVLATIAVVLLMILSPEVTVGQASLSGASSAVQTAFVSVQTAGKDGGNITSLVAQLNGALALLQKASAENSSNPAQASADLQSALTIAQQVQSSAAIVAQQGISARHTQIEVSGISATAIVVVAFVLYVYGDTIYRRLWLRIYGSHVVRKVG